MLFRSGLVIEHQALSGISATQELQVLISATKGDSQNTGMETSGVKRSGVQVGTSPNIPSQTWSWIFRFGAWCILPLILSAVGTYYFSREEIVGNPKGSTAGVVREATIERQFALALLENNLKHWSAVSEYFPPLDAVSRNYNLKAQLQIARLRIEGDDLLEAEPVLRSVIDSPYADEVLRTIALIDLGWIQQRVRRAGAGGELKNENYDRALRDMSTLVPDKQKLIRDALPSRVRTEWETVDYRNQTPPE